jgi:SAM-dependent methyltransferase
VPSETIYTNYLSVRGGTESSKKYFDKLSTYIDTLYSNEKTVLDIGCNDGTALDAFSKKKWVTYGVDPADNLFEITKVKSEHKIIKGYWNNSTAKDILDQLKNQTSSSSSSNSNSSAIDVILVINILAYVDNLVDFMESCRMIMSRRSRLYIQIGHANMILNRNFDVINHEHLSYFSIRSFNQLVTNHGMRITNLIPHSIYGGSYLFEVVLNDSDIKCIIDLDNHLQIETSNYKLSAYQEFQSATNKIITNISDTIQHYKSEGFRIIGYGASSKANMLINLVNMQLDYIIDDNESKIGLMTPGRNIRIYPTTQLLEDTSEKILMVILAWNWANEIKNKLNNKNTTTNKATTTLLTLQYFPEIKTTTIFTTH